MSPDKKSNYKLRDFDWKMHTECKLKFYEIDAQRGKSDSITTLYFI